MCLGLVCWSQPIFAKVDYPTYIIFWAKDTFLVDIQNTNTSINLSKEKLVAFCIFTKYVWAWSAGLQTDFATEDYRAAIQAEYRSMVETSITLLTNTPCSSDKYNLDLEQILLPELLEYRVWMGGGSGRV